MPAIRSRQASGVKKISHIEKTEQAMSDSGEAIGSLSIGSLDTMAQLRLPKLLSC